MLSKRYESTEVDRRTSLHVPSRTHWCTISEIAQFGEWKDFDPEIAGSIVCHS